MANPQIMRSLKKKFQRSLEREGVVGTLRLSIWNVGYYVREWTPSQRRVRGAKSEFDLTFGVDTGGNVELSDLEIASPNYAYGHRYQAVDPKIFMESLRSLAIEHENFVFVDFGSGKGMALLLASDFPFKKIIGVEFSPELHRVANQNIRCYHSETQRCYDVESVCADAATFPLPKERVVLYLNNPFEAKVMAGVVQNIERSLREYSRDLFVLYHTPMDSSTRLFDDSAALQKTASTARYNIYRRARYGAQ